MRIEKVFFTSGHGVVNIFYVKRVFAKTLTNQKITFWKSVFRRNITFLLSERSGTSKIWKLVEFHYLSSSGKVRCSELKPILGGGSGKFLRFWKMWMGDIFGQKCLFWRDLSLFEGILCFFEGNLCFLKEMTQKHKKNLCFWHKNALNVAARTPTPPGFPSRSCSSFPTRRWRRATRGDDEATTRWRFPEAPCHHHAQGDWLIRSGNYPLSLISPHPPPM